MLKEQNSYVNTKDLVGKDFHIVAVAPRQYRTWDAVEGKFKYSDTPKKGYQAFWKITLDNGTWSASGGQYSQILLAAESEGMSDVMDKDFNCQSNGKTGMDVRYFMNLITNK
jgi:hypothetical protein